MVGEIDDPCMQGYVKIGRRRVGVFDEYFIGSSPAAVTGLTVIRSGLFHDNGDDSVIDDLDWRVVCSNKRKGGARKEREVKECTLYLVNQYHRARDRSRIYLGAIKPASFDYPPLIVLRELCNVNGFRLLSLRHI